MDRKKVLTIVENFWRESVEKTPTESKMLFDRLLRKTFGDHLWRLESARAKRFKAWVIDFQSKSQL